MFAICGVRLNLKFTEEEKRKILVPWNRFKADGHHQCMSALDHCRLIEILHCTMVNYEYPCCSYLPKTQNTLRIFILFKNGNII